MVIMSHNENCTVGKQCKLYEKTGLTLSHVYRPNEHCMAEHITDWARPRLSTSIDLLISTAYPGFSASEMYYSKTGRSR